MRIKLRYLVWSGGPNFIPSVCGPVRLVRSEKYTQPRKTYHTRMVRTIRVWYEICLRYTTAVIVLNRQYPHNELKRLHSGNAYKFMAIQVVYC